MSAAILAIESDRDIILEYQSGNKEQAATYFVRKYQKFVFSVALRILQSYDDAEDASQEAFIKALNNIHKFRGDSSIKTWLYRITANVSNNLLRKRKLLSIFDKNDKYEEVSVNTVFTNPEKIIEGKEFEKKFMKILSKLPEKQRETFALRYFDELSYEEISQMLGTSIGGLKANYFQAVKKLAELLKNEIN